MELFHPVFLPEMEVAALEVLRSRQIDGGPKVVALESAFAAFVERKHIVATNDLTSAVLMALYLAGVREGDEVATVAFSCLRSNSPIAHLGARPVWIDIDSETMSMSVADLTTKLSPSVKAVMVYHIAGYPADILKIASLCRDRNIPLIEDCNNAIGATANCGPIGLAGDYAVYSFYPTRQINGINAGILATPDMMSQERASRLRHFGIDLNSFRDSRGEISSTSDVPEIGWSFKLNNFNAALALSQMNTLSERISRTKAIAMHLSRELSDLCSLRIVQTIPGATSAYWVFLVLSDHRDALLMHLKQYGIKSSILHQRNDLYTGFRIPPANLPKTQLALSQLLAIPCGWWLSDSDVTKLIRIVQDFDISLLENHRQHSQ